MKTMRINKTMRVGVIAAFVAILTIVGIAGTFAKYTTGASQFGSGRVAQWGVQVNAPSEPADVFKSWYATDDESASATVPYSVVAHNATPTSVTGDLVFAPGVTTNATFSIDSTQTGWSVQGQSETAVQLTGTCEIKFGESSSQTWIIEDGNNYYFYCPLVINKVGDVSAQPFSCLEYSQLLGNSTTGITPEIQEAYEGVLASMNTALANRVSEWLPGLSKVIEPNTDISTALTGFETSYTLSITWPFTSTITHTGGPDLNCDMADTYLGAKVSTPAGGTWTGPTVSVGLGLQVVQVD